MSFFRDFWKGGDGQTEAAVHSRAFHSYFEGYVERQRIDPRTGRRSIVRVYTAPYRVRRGSTAQWKRAKIVTALIYLLALLLFILSTSALELSAPAKLYQCIVACCYLCALYASYVFLSYLTAPRRMTVGDYRRFFPAFPKSCLVTAVFLALSFAARLLSAIWSTEPLGAKALLGFPCQLGAILLMLWIYRQEGSATYDAVENENAEETGVLIQR